jgi:hypothetical protein
MIKKRKIIEHIFLRGKNGGETLIGYTFCVGYIYRADCVMFNDLLGFPISQQAYTAFRDVLNYFQTQIQKEPRTHMSSSPHCTLLQTSKHARIRRIRFFSLYKKRKTRLLCNIKTVLSTMELKHTIEILSKARF